MRRFILLKLNRAGEMEATAVRIEAETLEQARASIPRAVKVARLPAGSYDVTRDASAPPRRSKHTAGPEYDDESRAFIHAKIAILRAEGKPQNVAIAQAINMARAAGLKVPPKKA